MQIQVLSRFRWFLRIDEKNVDFERGIQTWKLDLNFKSQNFILISFVSGVEFSYSEPDHRRNAYKNPVVYGCMTIKMLFEKCLSFLSFPQLEKLCDWISRF